MQTFSLLCATIFLTSFPMDLYLYIQKHGKLNVQKMGDSLKSMHRNTVQSFKMSMENMYILKNVQDYYEINRLKN